VLKKYEQQRVEFVSEKAREAAQVRTQAAQDVQRAYQDSMSTVSGGSSKSMGSEFLTSSSGMTRYRRLPRGIK
jgi:hypothetical protein